MHTNSTGESFVEHSARKNTHVVRNLGTKPVEIHVTSLGPTNAPFLIEADNPGCGC